MAANPSETTPIAPRPRRATAAIDPSRSFKSISWTRSFAWIMIGQRRRLAVKARRNLLLAVGEEVGRLHLCEVAAVCNCDELVARGHAEQRRGTLYWLASPGMGTLPVASRCHPARKLFARATSIRTAAFRRRKASRRTSHSAAQGRTLARLPPRSSARCGDTDRRRDIRERLTRATGTPNSGGIVSKSKSEPRRSVSSGQ